MKSFLTVICCIVLLIFVPGAYSESTLDIETTRAVFRTTFEDLSLPDSEHMGLAGGTVLYDVRSWLSVGPAAYGALSGERGGFITLGLAGEIKKALTEQVAITGGLFLGAGGGGSGGFELSGSGLMIRPHAGLNVSLGSFGSLGLGVSHVRFPDGGIDSTQGYVSYEHPFDTLMPSGWLEQGGADGPAPAGVSGSLREFVVLYQYYRASAGATTSGGGRPQKNIGLVGAKWSRYNDGGFFTLVESQGAMQGESNGYMQIFLGAGYRFPLARRTFFKLSAKTGVGGGGGVDTGGGFLVKSDVSLQQYITEKLFLSGSGGYVNAPDGSFEAFSATLQLGYAFDVPAIAKHAYAREELSDFDYQHYRIRLAHQTYFGHGESWRTHHSDLDVDNLGIQVDYFTSDKVYLTGQGLAAYARGKAGAYMKGLVGAGVHMPLFTAPFFLDLELLAGAAGGGGLNVGGGFVWQSNAGLGWRITDSTSFMLTAGYIDAPGGDFRATVGGASLAYRFTAFSR